jgi:ABC-type phosphate transport system substrate-binding protein
MTMRWLTYVLSATIVLGSLPLTGAGGFHVVAHSGVHVTTLTKSAASAIFMKKTPAWEGGTAIVPVDQTEASSVRAIFTAGVHGKSVAAVKSYWQQQIFSGRDVPPVEKASDAAVLDLVRATPGAIGYVSDGAPLSGVTVIEIK